jgi:hypothetical protein
VFGQHASRVLEVVGMSEAAERMNHKGAKDAKKRMHKNFKRE